jgi:hypothetical protein
MNEPAGSLEPININRGKWTDGLGALEISQLSGLAQDINKAVDQTVKQVARGKIRVGKLLLEARALFREDQAFGKWRKDNTMVQSKQHAHYLMKIAERFGDAPKLIEGANYSVLQELLLAEQADIEWIEEKIDKGEPLPTVVEVREQVKKSKGTSMKAKAAAGKLNITTPESPHVAINQIVQFSLTLRIKEVVKRGIKGIEGDFIILGMDPDPQCPCNPDALIAISLAMGEQAQNQDEERAVNDSYKRVKEEFKNWYRL